MYHDYKAYLIGLLWFVVVGTFIIVGGFFIGSAVHDSNQQTHKERMECLDRGGEIKYVPNVGTTCVKD